ncbi:TIGR03086 family metal-binding protein [Nocardioides sp. SR21]|uniref:TIGR03086 family metal-binding protein n=1 Tax=Nocardioides sp. SR21 TaxID=2919501 RepID=UPI001FAA0B7D|nr:TIGR03086 family metal-binding protein [Nocardioides sp. SR21]
MTATLGGSVGLLDRAIAYTCGQLASVQPHMLDRPTPCAAWTLGDLLAHMEDALDAFTEAAGGRVSVGCAGCEPGPVPAIQAKAVALVTAWTRPAPGDVVLEAATGRVDLQSPLLVTTAALEITVHGWDVGRATGRDVPVPPGLAQELLEAATWLVDPGDRGVRFSAARPVPAEAPYDQRLLGFLGRT